MISCSPHQIPRGTGLGRIIAGRQPSRSSVPAQQETRVVANVARNRLSLFLPKNRREHVPCRAILTWLHVQCLSAASASSVRDRPHSEAVRRGPPAQHAQSPRKSSVWACHSTPISSYLRNISSARPIRTKLQT
jgi:hypothetical protein